MIRSDNKPVRFYNLQGAEVQNPKNGIFRACLITNVNAGVAYFEMDSSLRTGERTCST